MKSEKIRRAIGGIDDDIIEAAESRNKSNSNSKIWISWGAVAAAFVLLLTGMLTLPEVFKNNPIVDDASVTKGANKTGSESQNQDSPKFDVIWADNNIMDVNTTNEGLTQWGKFDSVSIRLYDALESEKNDDVFAILARPDIDYEFEYKGKTIAAYYSAMCEEKNLPDLLTQLLKEGDALKYGTALYETGTPTGEKWYRSLYEERIEFYGEAILKKYIVNGEFLKEELKQDIATAKNNTESTDSYKKALAVYLDRLAASIKGSLPTKAVPDQYGIIMYLTKDQFSSFTVDNIEGWTFDLAGRDGSDEETVAYGVVE